ncbi:MAG: hypothetical protein ACI9TH_003373, partial [Kiritimatiellia bacterium]
YQTRYYVRLIGTFLGFGQIGCMIGLVGGVAHARDGRRRVRALTYRLASLQNRKNGLA